MDKTAKMQRAIEIRAKHILLPVITTILLAVVSSGVVAQAVDREVGPEGQKSVSLTVYNDDLALVRDVRVVPFLQGLNVIRLSDIAKYIDPASVRFASLTAPTELRLLEQDFEHDLVSTEKLLEKYIGKEIELVVDGAIRPVRLLAVGRQGGLIVEMDGKILIDPPGKIQLPALPSGVVTRPALVWQIESGSSMEHVVEVDYLTGGISWNADYVLALDNDENAFSLKGWITLVNRSGITYRDAALKLVAGEVRRVRQDEMIPKAAVFETVRAQAPAAVGEPVFEYHAYALDRRTTVANDQVKQVELLVAPKVPAKKLYVFETVPPRYMQEVYAGKKDTDGVKVIIEFQNKVDSGLGMPLPAGKIRVYKASPNKDIDFIGEDTIRHTPRDETVQLYVGKAFDIVGERTVTDYKRISSNTYEQACCIKLRNQKDEDVAVTVLERFHGEWTVTSPTPYEKQDANTAVFKVKVPRNKEVEILFRVRIVSE